MTKINQPSKEWAKNLGEVFGRRKPADITLRGTGNSIYSNEYEVALGTIHRKTKQLIRKHESNSELDFNPLLTEQERSIYILSYHLEVDADVVFGLNGRSSFYDFIVRPMPNGLGRYDLGLCDLLFVSDIELVPFILEFQVHNNVEIEGFDRVEFLKILHSYVPLHFRSRYPLVNELKLELIMNWVFENCERLSADQRRQFYWYELEYEPKLESNGSEPKTQVVDSDSSVEFKADNVEPIGTQVDLPRIKVLCSDDMVFDYFSLLNLKHPTRNKALLNKNAVKWIIGYYFGEEVIESTSPPKVQTSMDKQEWKFFIYQFHIRLSSGHHGQKRTPLNDLLRILKDILPSVFDKSVDTYSKNISAEMKKLSTPVKEMLDFSENKELAERFKFKVD